MLRTLSIVAFGLVCCAAHAQSVDRPVLQAGDSWDYTSTVETGQQGFVRKDETITVERVDSDGVLVSTKQDGSSQPPVESMTNLDWSRSRDVNGKQEVVNRPFDFPLREGKKWTVEYTELHPNRQHSSETVHDDYAVVGWEDVQVPAGKFRALKVEATGQWTAVVTPAVVGGSQAVAKPGDVTTVTHAEHIGSRTATGRLYKAFWYVPAEKRFVKSVEEYYDSKGVRFQRFSSELSSSKMAS